MKIYEIQNKGKGVISTLTPSNLLLLNPTLYLIDSPTVTISGKGTSVSPYIFSATPENVQFEIAGNTVLSNTFNNSTVFINNGASPVTITVPSGLVNNFCVGFVQEGTGDVTFVGSGVSLTNPVGLKSKGQGYATFIERKLNTSNYFLLGNTKA